MPSLVSKLSLLLFGTALSVAQSAAVEGPADSLSALHFDELDSSGSSSSSQVLDSGSIFGDNPFLMPSSSSSSSNSPGTLSAQRSTGCDPAPPPDQYPIKMRTKRDLCPIPLVNPNTASPGQGTKPTSKTDHTSNTNGQVNRNPKKQPWWQKFINLGNEIQDPKPCKHYRPFAVCAPPFTDIYKIFEIPLIEFCRLYDPTRPCNGAETLWCCVRVKIWAPSPQDPLNPTLPLPQDLLNPTTPLGTEEHRLAYPDAGAICVLQEKLWFAPD